MPKIVNIDATENVGYTLPQYILDSSNHDRFDYIFKNKVWAEQSGLETFSGIDSMMTRTELYRKQLHHFLDRNVNIKNPIFFDAPCGDLNWVKEFFDKVSYIGGDISGLLIDDLKTKYPHVDLRKFDIISDKFPNAHIWHCRHCLFHLSLADIALALENFCSSNINWAIITNHIFDDVITFDIPSGCYRFLNLCNYPFYLPPPKLWLQDVQPMYVSISMVSGVWEKSQIEQAVKNYHKYMNQSIKD